MTAAIITWKHACTYILCPLHSLARYFVHIWLPNCLGRMKTSQRTQCGDKYHTCIAGICILIEHILLLVCYLSMYCWVLLKGLRYLHISAGWVRWMVTMYFVCGAQRLNRVDVWVINQFMDRGLRGMRTKLSSWKWPITNHHYDRPIRENDNRKTK